MAAGTDMLQGLLSPCKEIHKDCLNRRIRFHLASNATSLWGSVLELEGDGDGDRFAQVHCSFEIIGVCVCSFRYRSSVAIHPYPSLLVSWCWLRVI